MNTNNFKLQPLNKPTSPLYFSEDIILQMEFSIKKTILMFVHPPIVKSLEKSIWALYKNLFGNVPNSFASLKTDYLKFLSSPEQWQWKQRPKQRTFY